MVRACSGTACGRTTAAKSDRWCHGGSHPARATRPRTGHSSASSTAVSSRRYSCRAWCTTRPNWVKIANAAAAAARCDTAVSNSTAFSAASRFSVRHCSRSQAAFAPNLPLGYSSGPQFVLQRAVHVLDRAGLAPLPREQRLPVRLPVIGHHGEVLARVAIREQLPLRLANPDGDIPIRLPVVLFGHTTGHRGDLGPLPHRARRLQLPRLPGRRRQRRHRLLELWAHVRTDREPPTPCLPVVQVRLLIAGAVRPHRHLPRLPIGPCRQADVRSSTRFLMPVAAGTLPSRNSSAMTSPVSAQLTSSGW